MFDEKEHPRDNDGKFSEKSASELKKELMQELPDNRDEIKVWNFESENVVNVDINADIQKQINAAKTPKERQRIAFRYIMDNLRGQYASSDGRTVAIERIGASKITSVDRADKLRACPALADMIKAGEYDHSAKGEDKTHKRFEEFVYYRIRVKMGEEVYRGMLNVGIRKNGSSTLYDLRPFDKEDK